MSCMCYASGWAIPTHLIRVCLSCDHVTSTCKVDAAYAKSRHTDDDAATPDDEGPRDDSESESDDDASSVDGGDGDATASDGTACKY